MKTDLWQTIEFRDNPALTMAFFFFFNYKDNNCQNRSGFLLYLFMPRSLKVFFSSRYDDYGFGGNLTATTPVYPPYNTTSNSSGVNFVNNHHATGNGPATSPLGLSTFGHIQFRETAIGSSAFKPHHNDMSVVGQSISYTLSRQSVPRQFSEYSTDSYQVNILDHFDIFSGKVRK